LRKVEVSARYLVTAADRQRPSLPAANAMVPPSDGGEGENNYTDWF